MKYKIYLLPAFSFFSFYYVTDHYRNFPIFTQQSLASTLVFLFSLLLTLHSFITLSWMLYAWENPKKAKKNKEDNSNNDFAGITALLPARHEERVIADTIRAINSINYPQNLKELIILCRKDDRKTIEKARKTIKKIGNNNLKLVIFENGPINKPHALNIGLAKAKYEIVTIFDAEDEPDKEIYNVVNKVFFKDRPDIIQSGVQLMNFNSHWYAALNVMEYYLWFKSGLGFFTKFGGVTPLGGNTVFFKKHWLIDIGGWDEKCLTEDADIGIRLTARGAVTKVIYDKNFVTKEETPPSVKSFVKQRTRWNQGFLQVFLKRDWGNLLTPKQKFVSIYILLSPLIQTMLFLYAPLGIIIALTQKLPVWLTLFSFLPLYLILFQLLIYCIALFTFTREYGFKFSLLTPFRIIFASIPYQILLAASSLRAVYRIIQKNYSWEKTLHKNCHRNFLSKYYAKNIVG